MSLSDWLFCFSWVTRFRLNLGKPNVQCILSAGNDQKIFLFCVCFCSVLMHPKVKGPLTPREYKSDHLFIFFLFVVLHCDYYPEFTTRRSVTDVTFAFTFVQCEQVLKAYSHWTKAILNLLTNGFSALSILWRPTKVVYIKEIFSCRHSQSVQISPSVVFI